MRLSLVFELLLIFVLLAFAASAVINSKGLQNARKDAVARKHAKKHNQNNRQVGPNRYCSCSRKLCNCCREFNIPVLSIQGPGCASLQYLKGDRLAISMSFGERVLTNTTISSKKPKPVCMPLPGGVSKFCGRVYNIGRKAEDFNACLGLELRSLENVEASVRVACFRFGPQGLRVEPPQPLPVVDEDNDNEDEDDDDDDEDEEEEEEYEFDDDDDDSDNDVDTADYGTFSVFDEDLLDDFFVGDSDERPSKKPVATTKAPTRKVSRKPTSNPSKGQQKPNRRKPIIKPKPTSAAIKQKITSSTTTTTSTTIVPTLQSAKDPEMVDSGNKQNADVTLPPITTSSMAPIIAETSPLPARLETQPTNIVEFLASTQIIPETSAVVVTEQQGVQQETTTTRTVNEQTTIIPEDKQTMVTEPNVGTTEENEDETTPETSLIEHEDDNNEDNDDDEDDDPITDAVEDIIDDDDSKETKPTDGADDKVNKNDNKKDEDDEVVDDIVDGMIDTLAGEDDETTTKKGSEDDDDDIEDVIDDEDEDEENDDEDEDSRKMRARRAKGRRSRDMWLDRLHW